jgi:hypothetical protein
MTVWLTRKEAAAHLNSLGYPISLRTLASLATRRQGPPYRRLLRRIVRYDRIKLEEWAKSKTSECGERLALKHLTGGALSMCGGGRRE